MTLPNASVDVLDGGLGIIQTPSTNVHVSMGCSSKGTTKVPYSLGSLTALTTTFGTGPGVKAPAYSFAKTQAPWIHINLPVTAKTATKSAVDSSGMTGTLVPTLTGTPLDQYNLVFVFTVGGTTGITGIFYKYSLDGGQTFTTPAALGTNLTVALTGTGLTANFITAKTAIANDQFTATTTAPSPAILPQTTTRVDVSTSTLTATGTPWDAYDFLLEVVTGGTQGTTGIVYRYSLDGGKNFTPARQLGVSSTISIDDGSEPSGLTVTVGAGTLDAGDTLTFKTTAPEAQSSDILLALTALKASAHQYNFVRYVGTTDSTLAGTLGTKMADFAAAGKYAFVATETRLKNRNETSLYWEQDLIDDFVLFADKRVSLSAGGAQITCPITGRQNIRPVMWIATPKLVSRPVQEDLGRKATGPLTSDVVIHDAVTQVLFEHDARVSPSLDDARFVTLRTYDDEAGIYFTRGPMMSEAGSDFDLIALRRVMDIGALVFKKSMEKQIQNQIYVNPPNKPNAGFIRERDARKIEREILSALQDALVAPGRVSDVQVQLSRTDNVLSTKTLTCDVRITPLGYVKFLVGTIAYTNPALAALQAL